MANAKSMKKGIFKIKRYVNKLTIYNRLKFKLASGIHGLKSESSRRDNGSSICVCCELDKEESVKHFLLECPLYNEVRDEILNDGDDAHRCILLLRDYGAFASRPLITGNGKRFL
eukprot:Awhi_evm1s2167